MLQLHRPPADHPAATWIQLLWEWRGYQSPSAVERILPHGTTELSWNLSAPHRFRSGSDTVVVPGAALIAARDTAYHVDTRAPAHLFSILFRPAAVASLLGVGLSELTGGIVALADFVRGAELEGRISDARTPLQRRDAVFAFLAELGPVNQWRESELLLAAWRDGNGRQRSVRSVREVLGLSSPTFVSRIRAQLGMRPAQLRQLLMFRDAVSGLASGGTPAARVAVDAGYCDQAHLNRAFLRHAGLTPGRFKPILPDHPFNLAEAGAQLSFDPIQPSIVAAE